MFASHSLLAPGIGVGVSHMEQTCMQGNIEVMSTSRLSKEVILQYVHIQVEDARQERRSERQLAAPLDALACCASSRIEACQLGNLLRQRAALPLHATSNVQASRITHFQVGALLEVLEYEML